jgi:NAD(P)-dependent dehydrogenase (short-subunit alcohol dehydrogenase family)
MARRFEGMSVFLTGASSGIGKALALELARQGARVALAARRVERLEAVQAAIEEEGGEALALCCDVTDRPSIDAAVARTVDVFGGIDIAVANAGFGVSGAFEQLTTDDYRRQFDTNVFGVIDTAHAVLPHLEASKGRLGIVASVMGHFGAPTTSAYCSSKFALCGFAESIQHELAEKGVSVICINPGVVESNFRLVDNQNEFHENRSDPAPQWLAVPAKKAAREITRALHRRHFEAVITGHGRILTVARRHFPRSFRWIMGRATRGRLDDVERRKRAQ